MSIFDKGLITILVCSAVFCLLSIPLILRKIPRNPVYGYRTRATLGDEALWYEANTYFGSRFLVATLIAATIAVALHQWQGLSERTFLGVSVALLAIPVLAAALLTGRFVRALEAGAR